MLQEVLDLRQEGDELFELLRTLKDDDWKRNTPFKNWTVDDVISHLHLSDWLAVLSVKDTDGFLREIRRQPHLLG